MIRLLTIFFTMTISTAVNASILPPNNLHFDDRLSLNSDMTEAKFDKISSQLVDLFGPIVSNHGAVLILKKDWESHTVNAVAYQTDRRWVVSIYGGLARRSEITEDGFALVLCHELGHHLAGFPFSTSWSGNEGQADYFAAQVCAPKIWASDFEVNERFRETVNIFAKSRCDAVWSNESRQNLCYRIAMAGKSLGDLFASANRNLTVSFETPDQNIVEQTKHSHPAAQCRLDTYLAGAVCDSNYDENIIPGKRFRPASVEAEKEAYQYSCSKFNNDDERKIRRACWYKAKI